jgi:hypothetical protein
MVTYNSRSSLNVFDDGVLLLRSIFFFWTLSIVFMFFNHVGTMDKVQKIDRSNNSHYLKTTSERDGMRDLFEIRIKEELCCKTIFVVHSTQKVTDEF